ncbi:hypothetical protein R3P38DRAFT_2808046 [Favolaschia claudopus]|uniref:Uncharacterized protein n=1 Tax=Favolaschia claudopus TaxID=2862362 RepID=A0AAV9ZHJ4_9AGAR
MLIYFLRQFRSRWLTFNVSGITPTDFGEFADWETPLLTEVGVIFTKCSASRTAAGVLASQLFRPTQHCQRISITGDNLKYLFPAGPFSWDHLTHLTLTEGIERSPDGISLGQLSAHTVYRLLKYCQNIFSLTIGSPQCFAMGFIPHERVLASSLRHLTFHCEAASSQPIADLIRHLRMPQLSLFHAPLLNMPLYKAASIGDLAAHSPFLSDLDLGVAAEVFPSLLFEVHRLFPVLSRLALRFPQNSHLDENQITACRTAFEKLTPVAARRNPTPELQVLQIFGGLEVAQKTWLSFLEGHVEFETNLRYFRLSVLGDPPQVIPDVTFFRACGVEAEIDYIRPPPKPSAWEGIDYSR